MNLKMKKFIFLNFDASHRGPSYEDSSVINGHVAKQFPRQRRNRDRTLLTSSASFHMFQLPLTGSHIGGLRTDPFDQFPIENKGLVPDAFDYCKCYERSSISAAEN